MLALGFKNYTIPERRPDPQSNDQSDLPEQQGIPELKPRQQPRVVRPRVSRDQLTDDMKADLDILEAVLNTDISSVEVPPLEDDTFAPFVTDHLVAVEGIDLGLNDELSLDGRPAARRRRRGGRGRGKKLAHTVTVEGEVIPLEEGEALESMSDEG